MDCTSSMGGWIQRSKDTLREIIDNVKNSNKDLLVRVCFVGYRDFCSPPASRYALMPFTDDIDAAKRYIAAVNAEGGGDGPEDV